MSIDLSQFRETFYEESFEGLDIMESGLLELDDGTPDSEQVNQIFRAAHSIKGGAGTFGFSSVGSLTHVMETVLDEMRDGRREVDQNTVQILLKGVDCLREMLGASRAEEEEDAERIAEVQAELDSLLAEPGGAPVKKAASETAAPDAKSLGWEIDFKPHAHLMKTGNDPVRIIRELEELGAIEVEQTATELPNWGSFDPEDSYLSWQIRILGDLKKDQIDEVFAWVDTDCDLAIRELMAEGEAAPAAPEASSAAAEDDDAADEVEGAAVAKAEKSEKRSSAGAAPKARKGEASSIRVGIEKVDELINMVGELVITQSMLGEIGENFDMSRIDKLRDGLSQLERNTRELQESVMRIRMVPVNFVFSRFPRVVHDVSMKLGKEIDLKISGEQTEVDKTVLERISDPLTHLVRNSLDHGIETPEKRKELGKPERGTVHLNAFHRGGNIVIEISDDGAGLNRDRLLEKAIEKGILKPDEVPADEKIHELIFHPGFSTAEKISDVSGRGVGMDVVKRNIDSLGGSISLETKRGEGTTVSIRLPLTLAILDGQTVSVGEEKYILPLVSIVETIQIKKDDIKNIAGGGEIFRLRDEYLPILKLSAAFDIETKIKDLSEGLIVVVEGGGQKVGLAVDDLQAQQQIVIKSLETNFRRVEGLSGATILGDGTVALILDVAGLVKMFGATRSRRGLSLAV